MGGMDLDGYSLGPREIQNPRESRSRYKRMRLSQFYLRKRRADFPIAASWSAFQMFTVESGQTRFVLANR